MTEWWSRCHSSLQKWRAVATAGLDEFDWTIDMRRQSAYVQDWTDPEGSGSRETSGRRLLEPWQSPSTSTIKNKEFWVLKSSLGTAASICRMGRWPGRLQERYVKMEIKMVVIRTGWWTLWARLKLEEKYSEEWTSMENPEYDGSNLDSPKLKPPGWTVCWANW